MLRAEDGKWGCLSIGGVVIRVQREKAKPGSFAVGYCTESSSDSNTVEPFAPWSLLGQDGLPVESSVGVHLLPGHSSQFPKCIHYVALFLFSQ